MKKKNLSAQDKKTLGILAGLYFIVTMLFSNDIGVAAVLAYAVWKRATIEKYLFIYISGVVFILDFLTYVFVYTSGFSLNFMSLFFDALMALLPAGFTYLALWVLFKLLKKK